MLSWWIFVFFLYAVSAKPSVIIIGAGPAGIAAATKLLKNSITNITILEAENRTGGRIHSFRFVDGVVDLGAQYCHGVKGNVAYELAKNYNILEPGLRGLQTNVYYSNGTKLNFEFVRELQEFYFNYHKIESNEFNVTGKALGDMIIYKYNNSFFKEYNSDGDKIKLLQEGLQFLEGYIVIHEGAFSWLHPSAECDYTQCEGPQNLIWKGVGYKTVLELMTKEFPDPSKKLPVDDKIHLSTSVQKIIWNNTQTIEVLTNDGSSFSANYVIFTPSVGVLKRQKDDLFEPQLPIFKKEAIEATGFEGVMKVFLYFPRQWWNDNDDAFGFFWAKKDLDELLTEKTDMFWVTQFRYILKVPDNPNVWVGWISGDLVPEIENFPSDVFNSGCEYLLDKFLGKTYNITKISKTIRSDWVTNKNFGGTYSYTKAGFYSKNRSYQEDLAKPLISVGGKASLLFAGEATNPIHYSTVHGAIESGYREAERIINLHKLEQ